MTRGRLFCRRSARTALDRRTLQWFAAAPRRAATEGHQPQGPAPSSSMQHRISRFDLLYRSSSLRFVFTPWMPRLVSGRSPSDPCSGRDRSAQSRPRHAPEQGSRLNRPSPFSARSRADAGERARRAGDTPRARSSGGGVMLVCGLCVRGRLQSGRSARGTRLAGAARRRDSEFSGPSSSLIDSVNSPPSPSPFPIDPNAQLRSELSATPAYRPVQSRQTGKVVFSTKLSRDHNSGLPLIVDCQSHTIESNKPKPNAGAPPDVD